MSKKTLTQSPVTATTSLEGNMAKHPDTDPDNKDPILRAIRRRNHRKALELLARGHARQLGRLCYAMTGDQAEAEELTQEILIAAYHAMPGFEGRSSIRTWLYTIARRTCSRTLERRRRRCSILANRGQERIADPSDPLELLESGHQQERLRLALDRLPPGQREVLLLRYVSGLRFREVAGVCGINEDAARQRASAGLRRLRRALTPRESADPQSGGADGRSGQTERQVGYACQELSR